METSPLPLIDRTHYIQLLFIYFYCLCCRKQFLQLLFIYFHCLCCRKQFLNVHSAIFYRWISQRVFMTLNHNFQVRIWNTTTLRLELMWCHPDKRIWLFIRPFPSVKSCGAINTKKSILFLYNMLSFSQDWWAYREHNRIPVPPPRASSGCVSPPWLQWFGTH